jgi:hypothetical protein
MGEAMRETIFITCSKCNRRAALSRAKLTATHGVACPMPSLLTPPGYGSPRPYYRRYEEVARPIPNLEAQDGLLPVLPGRRRGGDSAARTASPPSTGCSTATR